MAKQLMPRAELELRPSDVPWTAEQCLQLSLFSALRRKPSLERFPGAVVLRRYRRGELICRQGDAGWTAFYILTSEDVLEVLRYHLKAVPEEQTKRALIKTIALQFQRVRQLREQPRNHELRQAASVHLTVGRQLPTKEPNWWRQLQRHWLGGLAHPIRERPLSIPFDGPTEIDYDSRQAIMYEGELFGEMSCLNRTPRSATVVATQDCYVLEMLRHILDHLLKEPAFKKQVDDTYRQRVMQLHLRQLPLLSSLTEEQFNEIHNEVELVTYEPGQLICDEHDRSDCLYIIRRGLVKVQKGVSALLGPEQIHSWPDLCSALRIGSRQRSGPQRALWRLLPGPARTAALHPEPERLEQADRVELLLALNELIKNPHLPEHRAFREILRDLRFRQRARVLLKRRDDWSEQEARTFNRLLLGTVLAGIRAQHLHAAGPECTLGYCSRGDILGEIGLLAHEPRSATCIAYGQRAELMRISEALFNELLQFSADIRRKLQDEVARREKRTHDQLRLRVWEEGGNLLASEDAERLGLIQGQQLMLIDLHACTRCDECVKACVATHGDGRTRLFLDGPRFGQYQVPTTCRSCLDPVCMIGCPVGAIHRGDNKQITIEDWCIGCGLCAKQCPYGAIQMHDLGLIPEDSRDWRYLPASAVGETPWYVPNFRDRNWILGKAPFRNQRDFQASLLAHRGGATSSSAPPPAEAVCFRYAFVLAAELLEINSQLKLEVATQAVTLRVWLNGQELTTDKLRGGKCEFRFPATSLPPARSPSPRLPRVGEGTGAGVDAVPSHAFAPLRPGRNLLAVQVTPGPVEDGLLLQVRMDEIRRPALATELTEEINEMLVTHRAVVCDLCCTLPGQEPACVSACPHEAAMRVDARFELPGRLRVGSRS